MIRAGWSQVPLPWVLPSMDTQGAHSVRQKNRYESGGKRVRSVKPTRKDSVNKLKLESQKRLRINELIS